MQRRLAGQKNGPKNEHHPKLQDWKVLFGIQLAGCEARMDCNRQSFGRAADGRFGGAGLRPATDVIGRLFTAESFGSVKDLHLMSANNSAGQLPGDEGGVQSAKNLHDEGCELLLYKLAIDPRASLALRSLPVLCPTCSQLLRELLTTVGLGAKRAE